jgi:hypothetical protein
MAPIYLHQSRLAKRKNFFNLSDFNMSNRPVAIDGAVLQARSAVLTPVDVKPLFSIEMKIIRIKHCRRAERLKIVNCQTPVFQRDQT